MKKTLLACAISAVAFATNVHSAVYEVEVLPANDLAPFAFAQSIDNTGLVTLAIQNEFNQPIDVSLLDFDDQTLVDALEDPDGAANGVFTDQDYGLLIGQIRRLTNERQGVSILRQKLPNFRSAAYDGQTTSDVFAFDVFDNAIGGLTQSNRVVARDSLNGEYIVGTSEDVFRKLDYTDEDGDTLTYVINDFRARGFVQTSTGVTPLLSPDQLFSGFSEAHAINNNLQVAGFGIISIDDTIAEVATSCADDEIRGDSPVEACLWAQHYPIGDGNSQIERFGQVRALIWQLDGNDQVVSTQVYDLLAQPDDGDNRIYRSSAFDINDAGIAVGFSSDYNDRGVLTSEAVVFQNGETIRLLSEEEFEPASTAQAINNNNWVTGTVRILIDGSNRDKMFVNNLDSGDLVVPEGFFSTSAVVPRDINNNNIVVGEADVFVQGSGVREKHAFMYDIEADTFTDLNSLIQCDAPYVLVDAASINDNNEIVVTARARTAAKDFRGNDILNDDGETVDVDTTLALKLTPIANGEADSCEITVELPERQGASSQLFWLSLLLLGLGSKRRKIDGN